MQLLQFDSREKWLEARSNYITASDIGVVLGVNKYKSPAILAKEKRDKVSMTKQTTAMKFGNVMERTILRCFELETGLAVNAFDNNLCVNDKYPRLAASLDGLVEVETGERIVVDAKMSSGGAAWQWGKQSDIDGVPPTYYVQMQHQMLVAEADFAYLAVMLKPEEVTDTDLALMEELTAKTTTDSVIKVLYSSGYKFFMYRVRKDETIQKSIVIAADNFWSNYIDGDKEPEIDRVEDIKQLGIVPVSGEVEVDDELYRRLAEFSAINKQKNEIEKVVKEAGDKLKVELMKYSGGTYNGKQVFSYKASEGGVKFDEEAFKKEHPDIWSQYQKNTLPTRRFTVNIK